MDREQRVSIARTLIANHEDPSITFVSSPEYLARLKRIVGTSEKPPPPSHHVDAEGLKWEVLGSVFPRDEINLPRDQRHYSYFLSRPSHEGTNGFVYKRVPVGEINAGANKP